MKYKIMRSVNLTALVVSMFAALCLVLEALVLIINSAIPAVAQQYVPGNQNMATVQATIGATAVQILAAHAGRASIRISNAGSVDVYLGNSSSVTTSTGLRLPGSSNFVIELPYQGALYGISASSDVVTAAELF